MNVFKKRKWMGAKLFLMLVFLSMAGNAAAKLPNGLEAEMIFAQSDDKTFYGHVFDENGEALIGVTVRNANTKEGTVTDFNGAFSLTLKKGQTATLVFSYVGKKEVKIEATAGKAIKVVMEDDAELLDDVIVTGYQTISKERATGAYSIVKAADLEEKPTANISSMLNGLVPGLAVKGSPTDGGNRFVIRV